MADRKLEMRRIEDLLPYARNARTHTAKQIEQVAASIKEFGWTNPVLIDANGGIVAGHARVEAAKLLALTDVPCICLEGLSEAQARAYIIADNKLALNAGWDEELLRLEIGDLKDLDLNLELLGFDANELADLQSSDGSPDNGGESIVPDASPNILAKLSFPPAVWLGKRDEIMAVFDRMTKNYLCNVRVDE